MGDCQCSNITIMQLFHELKQQFPALPDHVVSQCITQNSYDRETCARTLREAQESRPSPGAFPPPPPECPISQTRQRRSLNLQKIHRPVLLDIAANRKCSSSSCAHVLPHLSSNTNINQAPSSAPVTFPSKGFFTDPPITASTTSNNKCMGEKKLNSRSSSFEVNVNVACSSAENHDARTNQIPAGPLKSQEQSPGDGPYSDNSRSYTSVNLTLRPPCSEPQAPIEIRSQGSSFTYSTSSVDPRGFQSRLQISIGPGKVGSVTAARIRPTSHTRPSSLLSSVTSSPQKPSGLPTGPPSQLPRPTMTMSAPTTPSAPAVGSKALHSLPTTPATAQIAGFLPQENLGDDSSLVNSDLCDSALNNVTEQQKQVIREQLLRKETLAKALRVEKGRLDAMKKEIQAFMRPIDSDISPQTLKQKLRSEIYQLQLECDRLADEVDQSSESRVPLGETNEEFYQDIYTGQILKSPEPRTSRTTLNPISRIQESQNQDENQDDRDGASWVCGMCTFKNHPLMDQCEQCDMPRIPTLEIGRPRVKPVFSLLPSPQLLLQQLSTATNAPEHSDKLE